jgi:hypothetical protein
MSTPAEVVQLFNRIKCTENHYDVLSLPKFAPVNEAELKKTYMRLAKVLHPDKCKLEGATQVFQKVGPARVALVCARSNGQGGALCSNCSTHCCMRMAAGGLHPRDRWSCPLWRRNAPSRNRCSFLGAGAECFLVLCI